MYRRFEEKSKDNLRPREYVRDTTRDGLLFISFDIQVYIIIYVIFQLYRYAFFLKMYQPLSLNIYYSILTFNSKSLISRRHFHWSICQI